MLRILSVIAFMQLCRAQQPQTFRTSTTLIEFTIVALDAKGSPVTDLQREEIVLTENGVPRPVAFLRFEGDTGSASMRPVPPGAFTNRSEYLPGPPRNVTAIVYDRAIHARFETPRRHHQPKTHRPRPVDGTTRHARYPSGTAGDTPLSIKRDCGAASYPVGQDPTE